MNTKLYQSYALFSYYCEAVMVRDNSPGCEQVGKKNVVSTCNLNCDWQHNAVLLGTISVWWGWRRAIQKDGGREDAEGKNRGGRFGLGNSNPQPLNTVEEDINQLRPDASPTPRKHKHWEEIYITDNQGY